MYNSLNERDVETIIDNELRNLEWKDAPRNKQECTVFKQNVKTKEQKQKLGNKRPDYVLYKENSDEPLAIIEAKKPPIDIRKALKQGIDYAKKINAPTVFITDGIYTKTHHIKKEQPLYLNGEEVDELLPQKILINYLQDNVYSTQDKKVIESREELIKIFKDINKLFRQAGVVNGIDRIDLMSNMLFLKVISELHEINDNLVKLPPEEYLWNNFKNKKGLDLLDFINKQAFEHFKKAYGGDVLTPIRLLNGKETSLEKTISKLDPLWLSDTNSDIKGDAFEFFLRNYGGAETDLGQYFTPRHIVKTLVKLLNPQFGEKIYDPFCGTGGMLIESFKHIRRRIPQIDKKNLTTLKSKTIYGGEITTISRIAKMNMILMGDGSSNITEQDSYENKQTGKYDVVITNIPFGIRMKNDCSNSNYGYGGDSAQLAGVLHCLDALNDSNPNARAGILIPEGILDNKSKWYTALRRDLIEKHDIENIVSLPRGVFTHTAVKSNILIVKKKKNTKKNTVWYFNVKNDGFTLDKKRTKIAGENDLDILKKETYLDEKNLERLKKIGFKIMYKDKLRNNEYVLQPNQYESQEINKNYEMSKLGDNLFTIEKGKSITKEKTTNGSYPVIAGGKTSPYSHNAFTHKKNIITVSASGAYSGYVQYHSDPIWASDCSVIYSNDENKCLTKYLYYVLKNHQNEIYKIQHGSGQPHVYPSDIKKIKIPLPSIEEQKRIVEEIEVEEKIIEENKKLITIMENKIQKRIDSLWK